MNTHHSLLADVPIDKFTHNNMVPFFGGSVQQNMDDTRNEILLEKYTGQKDFKIEKSEQSCFSDVHHNKFYSETNIYEQEIERMEKPSFHNNILPMEQIKVGPGFTNDTSDSFQPSGGFQQDAYRDVQYYKNVDELRAKNKPKTTFEGRVVDGIKETKRGSTGIVDKNSVDTYYEQYHSDLHPNTSENKKDKYRSCIDVKETNRKCAVEYTGVPYLNNGETKQGEIKAPFKTEGSRNDVYVNKGVLSYGTGNKDDYGKKNIIVYDNERNLSTTQTYQGNLTSYVKSMIQPFTDIFRNTNKDFFIKNPREFGAMHSAIPKQTIYNPNDTMKTTIKETTIHDERTGNLKGMEQITTYDPNHVARTTIKETTIHDSSTGNIKLKPKSIVYNADEIAKRTLRETLKDVDVNANLTAHKKQTTYNPNDPLRTTVKETTIDNNHIGGVSALQDSTGYLTNKHYAKHTNKQFMSDNEHKGNPSNTQADGYKNANVSAKNTHKQFTSDNEYFGISASDQDAMMSYDNIYNAIINNTREKLFKKPIPTLSGRKTAQNKNDVHLTSIRNDCNTNKTSLISKVYQDTPSADNLNVSINKKEPFVKNCNDDRLDPSLLKAFKSNPYTHPLNNAV